MELNKQPASRCDVVSTRLIRDLIKEKIMKQGMYRIGNKKEIIFENVRKMSDEELWSLFDDICIEEYSEGYDTGYDKGYDNGYDEAREECWW